MSRAGPRKLGRRKPAPALRAHAVALGRAARSATRDSALASVGEKIYRVWRIYMAGSAHAFERGWMSIYQVLGGQGRCRRAARACPPRGNTSMRLKRLRAARARCCDRAARVGRARDDWDYDFDDENKAWKEIEAQLPRVSRSARISC